MMSRCAKWRGLIHDDEEITKCKHCHLSVQSYNNTSITSITTSSISRYTKTLLKYHHLNCEKCGLFIEFHPKETNEESLVFVCSNSIPHRHCLCYECGLLYDINEKSKSMGIIDILQSNKTENDDEQIMKSTETQNSQTNLMDAHAFSTSTIDDMVNSSSAFITQIMNETENNNNNETMKGTLDKETINETDGTLLMGLLCSLLVWIGIYFNGNNIADIYVLFRFFGCIIWITLFYILSNIYFSDNNVIQRSVYSLFGISPIFATLWILRSIQNKKDLQKDLKTTAYFFVIAGCSAYLSFYYTPLDMISFLMNDFINLSISMQIMSLFFSISICSFIYILFKKCGVTCNYFVFDNKNHHQPLMMVNNDNKNDKIIIDDEIDDHGQELKVQTPKTIEITTSSTTTTTTTKKRKNKRRRRRRKKEKRIE